MPMTTESIVKIDKESRSESQATSLSLSGLSSPGSIELLEEKEIFPDLYNSAFADFLQMTDSQLNSVKFVDVEQSYPTDGDIVCRFFIVNDNHSNPITDKIALLEVGWKTLADAVITMACANSVSDTSRLDERKIVFSSGAVADKTNEDEFYQFCYVTAGDNVLGASTPFRVFRPNENDFIEIQNRENNDDDDFIVVRSEQALLQERLQQLATSNGLLEYTKRSLEQKVATMERENTGLRTSKTQLEESLLAAVTELKTVSEQLEESKMAQADMHNELEVSRKKCDDFKRLKSELEKEHADVLSAFARDRSDRRDLQSENSMLRSQLEDIKAMVETLRSNNLAINSELKKVDEEKRNLKDITSATVESLTLALEESETRYKKSAEKWSSKERELEKKLDEMTLRLKKAAEEYEEKYKQSLRVEGKLQRLQSRVEKYITKPKLPLDFSAPAKPEEVATALEEELTASKAPEEDVEILTLPCIICKDDILCTVKDMRPMTTHLEDVHKQRVCPVCSQMFDATMDHIDKYFHMHVENHFDNPAGASGGGGGGSDARKTSKYLTSADLSGFSALFP